ncbi:MAG TPA: tetratricopeptide repeat protein [Blastocatellia bacterium]|nr:tetratricopeptide repeat protein [Blastocatellia bacterium]
MLPARKRLIVGIALVAATFVTYEKTRNHGFVSYDDATYVTGNARVQSGLSLENVAWAFSATEASNWHPLTWISHMLDCQLHGLNAPGHLLTNILLHAASAVLLFLCLHAMTGALWRSGIVAALFALHPLNVESVAWVAERKNVLSMLLMLATLLAYIRYARKPEWKRYLLVPPLFALGLMAKPMLVTLPFALLLLDYWPLGRLKTSDDVQAAEKSPRSRKGGAPRDSRRSFPAFSISRLAIEKAPLLALSAASSAITVIAQSRSGAVGSAEAFPAPARLANAAVAYVAYLRKSAWPSDLAVFYPHPLAGIPVWQVVLCVMLLAGFTLFAVFAAKRARYVIVGWLWYLGTLVPVIGLVQVGLQSMADRYAYVPLIGIFIAVVWGIAAAARSRKVSATVTAVGAAAVLLALSLVTRAQLDYWTNSAALFERALSVTEQNYIAHNNLGEELARQGRPGEAADHFAKAIEIKPDFPFAHVNLGMALVTQGNLDAAIERFDAALEIDPSLFEAHSRRGAALASRGKLTEAISSFSKALEINPGFAPALANLGFALDRADRPDEAIDTLNRALQLRMPDELAARVHYALGRLLSTKGATAEASSHYREAVRLKPDLARTPTEPGPR